MTRGAQRVLDEALRLSPEEQALVLRELLARLDGEPDPEAEAEWAREIERRVAEARAGAPAAGDWETICDELEAELQRKP
ncbi:addiction module protein [Archangium sp.]|jgi:putative addiction module component (TIGR02574 family)|uniref:addiction module protein n=1 Tax=Archangium sp. TaxID=1872627 RepID=UPI002ED8E08D